MQTPKVAVTSSHIKVQLAKKPLTTFRTECGNTFGVGQSVDTPRKTLLGVRKRYFKTLKDKQWTFACTISDRRGKEKNLVLFPIAYTSIERHIKVKGEASPDDPSLKEYWEKRHQKFGKSYWEKNSRNYKIAQIQNWSCPICGEPLLNGEEIDTHHIVPVAQGGLDDVENLQHLHIACHKQVHSKKPKFSSLK